MPDQTVLIISEAFEVFFEVDHEARRFSSKNRLEVATGAVLAEAEQVDEGVNRESVVADEPVYRNALILDVDLEVANFEAWNLPQLLNRHVKQRPIKRVCVEVVEHELRLHVILKHGVKAENCLKPL